MKTAEIIKKIPQSLMNEFLLSLEKNTSEKGQRLFILTKVLIKLIPFDTITKELIKNHIPDTYKFRLIQKDLHDLKDEIVTFLSIKEFQLSLPAISYFKQKAISKYNLFEIAKTTFESDLNSIFERDPMALRYNQFVYELSKMPYDEKNNLIGKLTNPGLQEVIEIDNLYKDYLKMIRSEIMYLGMMQLIALELNDLPESVAGLKNTILSENLHFEDKSLILLETIYRLRNSSEPSLDKAQMILNQLQGDIHIPQHYLNLIIAILRNIFVIQINKGNNDFNPLHFQLHKFALDQNLYSKEINVTLYRNIIWLACQEKEYSWALEFSEEYRHKLPQEEQETAYSFNKARIFQNMGSFEKVVETLRDVEYKDITYNLNSKLMLMGAFYELDEYEPLLSTIRAFKVFLRRRRNISVKRKANFSGFCDALYNIIMAEEKRDVKRVQKARTIIKNNPAIPNTNWLKDKIDALGLEKA